ncbi:sensor histidine kinase [Desulfovirgula thermocuniculi]|uniref:sensor histidine kinase n=1 Tax=Desulfovirgula thermocuniculi TaxID=348842 RepID=UPI0004102476|nr:histidine kinase [Desulfovirgula thermocuniculi]
MKGRSAGQAWGPPLFLALALAAFLFFLACTTYALSLRQDRLRQDLAREEKCFAAVQAARRLAASAQEYVLFGDDQALNDFRHYSQQAARLGLELYELAGPGQKQAVEELLALTRAYSSFMENEVVPALQGGPGERSLELLRWQHRDMTRQLLYRTDALAALLTGEAQKSMREAAQAVKRKAAYAFILSLCSLGALAGAALFLAPRLARYVLLRRLVGSLTTPVLLINRRERVEYLNPGAAALLQVPREEVTGRAVEEVLRLFPHLQGLLQPLLEVLLSQKTLAGQQVAFVRDGQRTFLVADYLPVKLWQKTAGAAVLVREVRPHRDGQNILLDTLERERKRISIEIHDWIGRYMSALIQGLDYLLHKESLPQEARESVLVLRGQCQQAAIEMRNIMNDIHPYLIEKAGLIPALESYVANFEHLHKKKVFLYYQSRSLPLDPEAKIMVYRIVQEALTNVARHSPASEVDIYFADAGDHLNIEIIDNGGVKEEAPLPGKGLWGMKERAQLVGGQLSYGYRDTGFYVSLVVPKGSEGKDGEDQDHAGGRP